nr:integrase, catalytic region, zinc finger, CCHC-type, peptidase aspartic, catalytic [Tanacetum cinerariifolium]
MSTLTFSKTHNLIAYLAKPTKSEGFEHIIDFLNGSSVSYALTTSLTIRTSCIKQFCTTAKVKTINDEVRIQALVDEKRVNIKESSIHRTLKLDDAEGTSCLANAEIFDGLAKMGYEKLSKMLTFYKAFFSPQWKFLIHTILQCLNAKTNSWNEFSSTIASAIICLAINQKFNFSRYILLSLVKNIEAGVPFFIFLSMQDVDDEEPANVEEVLEVVKAAKLMTELVTTAEATKVSVLRRRRHYYSRPGGNNINSCCAFREVTLPEKEVEVEAHKREGESLEKEITKKQKMDEQAKELRSHLHIVSNDDDVYTEATPLALKFPIVDYKIHLKRNKPYFKIIRADASVWRDQKGRYGLAKRYPLTHFTLKQMLNNVRFEVKEESEMYLKWLRDSHKPKRKRDESWFKDKVLLVQAQVNGQILHEEELAFLADPGIVEAQTTQTVITHNATYQADDLDAYDSDCNEINTAKVSVMANSSHYGSNDLAKVHNHVNVNHNLINQAVQAMPLSEQLNIVNQLETEITSDSNIISYSQYKASAIVIRDSEETLMLAEDSQIELSAVQAFWSQNFVSSQEPTLSTRPTQVEDMVIKKLKERIKSLSGNIKEKKIKKELEEIETINIKLDHRVTKLIAKNEHLKQTYKQLYDSIKSSRIRSKEQCDDLIKQVNLKSAKNSDLNASLQEQVLVITALKDNLRKLKGKAIIDEAIILHSIDPEMLKVNVAPLATKLQNNRTVHSDYLKHTQEETATLREIVEHERVLNPLNTSLDYAYKYTKRVQELLIIIRQTCPCINNLDDKLMAVTLMNKTKRVRFTEPVTSSRNTNIKTVSSSNVVSNKPMLSSTRVNLSTSASGLQPLGNTKKDKIQQTSSSSKKNKIKAHPRNVRSSLRNKNYVVKTKNTVGISYETSVARSPQENGIVERRNHMLIEAARTMLIYARALLFLWAEAVATACFTQNRSIIRLRHGKKPYELLHDKLSDLSYFHVFSALCYSTNDSENLGKLQPKADIGRVPMRRMLVQSNSS